MVHLAVHSPDRTAASVPAAGHPVRRDLAALLMTPAEVRQREMEKAFRDNGGMATSDEVASLLHAFTDQPISMVARWIVDRDVLSFEGSSGAMLPLFQFGPGMRLRQEVVDVIHALAPAMDNLELCTWFTLPNTWLGNTAPVEAIEVDARAVYDAARADYFLEKG